MCCGNGDFSNTGEVVAHFARGEDVIDRVKGVVKIVESSGRGGRAAQPHDFDIIVVRLDESDNMQRILLGNTRVAHPPRCLPYGGRLQVTVIGSPSQLNSSPHISAGWSCRPLHVAIRHRVEFATHVELVT